ncbi:MAG: hypothetical protein IKJ33_03450 [Clostridia bacterium]|nr:hypothetical protein [Clostridia bacterium]
MSSLENTINALRNSNMMSALNEGRKSVDANHIENAPISCNLLQQNGSKIIIKDELVEKLAYIKSTIDRQKNTGKLEELPFAMMGYKDEQGNVIISDIVYDSTMFEERLDNARPGSLDTAAAIFDEKLSRKMSNHLQRKDISHPVVIHGHTHPQHLGVSDKLTNNFSLADMEAYQQFQTNTQRVNPNAEVFGMVVNEIGDFNIVTYNSQENTFERVNQVAVGDTSLPSFSDGHYLINGEARQEKDNSLLNKRRQVYSNLLKDNQKKQQEQQEREEQQELFESEPKIERVTRAEIEQANYYENKPQTHNYEKPKEKGFFARIKDFIGQVFSCCETGFFIDDSIKNAKSIANPNIGKKLEALKMQDKMNGIEIGE